MTLPNYPDPTGQPVDPGAPISANPIQPGNAPQFNEPAQLGYPGQPGWAPPPGYPPTPYPAYVYAPAPPTNGMAIASMVTSIAAILVCYGLPGIVGALLGHSARKQIRERGEGGAGMALAGIIVGWIGFAISMVVTIGFILLFVIAAQETSSSTYNYE